MLEEARTAVADELGFHTKGVIFVGTASEANNLAVEGIAKAVARNTGKKHIVVSAVEHASVLAAARRLRDEEGFGLTEVFPVFVGQGDSAMAVFRPQDFVAALRDDTVLVSIMFVNNEIGMDLRSDAIARAVKRKNPAVIVHTDAAQAAGKVVNLKERLRTVDAVTISGHKFGGPSGVAALLVREGVPLRPMVVGGPQERGRRAGTENVEGCMGFAAALVAAMRAATPKRTAQLCAYVVEIVRKLQKSGVPVRVLGPPLEEPGGVPCKHRVPHIVMLGFETTQPLCQSMLLRAMDEVGVAVGSTSACNQSEAKANRNRNREQGPWASHVLNAVVPPERISNRRLSSCTVRLGMSGATTTHEDCCRVADAIKRAVRIQWGRA